MPHLDTYNEEDIDEQAYEGLSPSARAAAEKEMRKRDRQDALTHGRARPGLLYGEWEVCMCVCVHVCMARPGLVYGELCVFECMCVCMCVFFCNRVSLRVPLSPSHPDDSEADEDLPPARKRKVDRATEDSTAQEDQVVLSSPDPLHPSPPQTTLFPKPPPQTSLTLPPTHNVSLARVQR